MYEELNSLCTYQKTMFPGLIYRPMNSPVVLLCFTSGKIVITGGKTIDDVVMGWTVLWCVVKRFIRKHAPVLDNVADGPGEVAIPEKHTPTV